MMVISMPVDMFDLNEQAARLRKWFDLEFYRTEYPDIDLGVDDLVEHYFRVGWIEGRNPNPFFDTVSYLSNYRDVAEALVNPYCHYLVHGMTEGRLATPSSTPSIRTELVFGTKNVRWVEELAVFVDNSYTLPDMPGYDLAAGKFSVNRAAHFAYRGWREDISPNATTDIQALKRRYSYASALHVNPLLALIEEARGTYKEPAEASSSISAWPHALADTLNSLPDDDIAKLNAIRGYFDADFYLANNHDVKSAGVDPLLHYYFEGWKEGRSPRSDFDTRYYLSQNTDVAEAKLCPFWHYIETGRHENRAGTLTQATASPTVTKAPDDAAPKDTPDTGKADSPEVGEADHRERLKLVRESMDALWYLSTYPDVKIANIDPSEHYYFTGWRENRNPSRFFSTEYYLSTNADVKRSEANPFWHYLVAGRVEGRLPQRLGGWRRDALAAAKEPHRRTESYTLKAEKRLSASKLAKALEEAFAQRGCVISISHDSYVKVIGGTQIFIADEQRKFNRKEIAYLHLSPVKPLLTWADYSAEFDVRMTLNGKVLGEVKMLNLIVALKRMRVESIGSITFIIHCVFGFSVEDLLALHSSLKPQRSLFWLHDFSSVCEGFNLLRNDIAFCGAPDPASLACRVCIYGENRARHVSRMRELFEHCNFKIVAPSQSTLDIWSDAISYKNNGLIVHPHWKFVEAKGKLTNSGNGKVSIGFLGYPSTSKGWPIFLELVDKCQDDERYSFFHLATRDTSTISEVTFVVTEVSDQDRSAPIRAIENAGLDFIAMLSQWPETFSFATYEALAAGASVLCFEGSGNVAAQVKQTGRGVVFSGKEELIEFFVSGAAVVARTGMCERSSGLGISDTGTSASIDESLELTQ
jgi:hypothetical protein